MSGSAEATTRASPAAGVPQIAFVDVAQDASISSVLVAEQELQRRVREIAAQIDADYAGQTPMLVGILRGSVMFLADLLRYVTIPVTVDFLAISSYSGRDSSGVVRLLKDLDHSVTGKHVLLVEDIIDTGLTLRYVLRTLRTREPASLEVCTLLSKPARRLIDHQLKYVGFDVPDVFVIGYGLDYNQRYRNLPFIGCLREP
jgi:hypoxanthine phosphoribosyltransferase